jgi:hypothetical protein
LGGFKAIPAVALALHLAVVKPLSGVNSKLVE